MTSLVVVGAQWGDEGKGKLVDVCAENADWVVRYQGGNNAGHTLVVNGKTLKLSLLPSGVLREHATCVIGSGVVLNTEVLLREMALCKEYGVAITPERLIIDARASLIFSPHILIDRAREERRGSRKIGTTCRGIGPAYEDRAARRAVRLADLHDEVELRLRIEQTVDEWNRYLRSVLEANEVVRVEDVWQEVQLCRDKLLPFVGNASVALHRAVSRGERIVFEGAQGVMLDVTYGSVPYVTSSPTLAGAAPLGVGLGPQSVDCVLGVAKAYCTRVGSGPFPSEIDNEVGTQIREAGAEFGTVTGRPRRCGWFDAFALKSAVRMSGLDSLAVTKLDVLTGVNPLRVCVGYHVNGVPLEDVPVSLAEWAQVVPQYVEMEGWSEDITAVRTRDQLPNAAQQYLSCIEHYCGCPAIVVSVGADRGATIVEDGDLRLMEFITSDGSKE